MLRKKAEERGYRPPAKGLGTQASTGRVRTCPHCPPFWFPPTPHRVQACRRESPKLSADAGGIATLRPPSPAGFGGRHRAPRRQHRKAFATPGRPAASRGKIYRRLCYGCDKLTRFHGLVYHRSITLSSGHAFPAHLSSHIRTQLRQLQPPPCPRRLRLREHIHSLAAWRPPSQTLPQFLPKGCGT